MNQVPNLAGGLEQGVIDDCWNRVGVTGDQSCPELPAYVHCRNCHVYSQAAAELLDRASPDGYIDERSHSFAEKKQDNTRAYQAVIVFRIASEWLALPASCAVEVSNVMSIHSLPTHKGNVVLGLVNVRGELLICVSLAHLLDLPQSVNGPSRPTGPCPRFLVIQGEGGRLVIPVDEMHGLHRFHPSELKSVPFTAASAQVSFANAMLPWEGHMVGCLDDQLLIYTLNRSLA